MLRLSTPFDTSFLHDCATGQDNHYHQQQPNDNATVVENVQCLGLVTNNEKATIENSLGRLYLACWQDHVLQLRDSLADLDDTLHEFRRSSSAASNKVLETMHERYAISLASLKSCYSEILQRSTSNAFADGRSSWEYRRERFLAVAGHFSLPLEQNLSFLSELLWLYETSLKESLKLKSGALNLLRTIKRLGKKIVVITEGPQDAQEWTVENLGISSYIDFLATTNCFKTSKTDGLFSKVLETLGITSSNIAYVGDNEHRDMKPAIAKSILSFHFAESLNCNLEVYPLRINTLNKLEYILVSSGE